MKSNITKLSSGFTQVPNEVLQNNIISLKAKGLFCYLQSRPDNWQFSSERMAKIIKEGVDSVRSGLIELERNNFLTRTRLKNGRMIYTLHLSDIINTPVGESPSGSSQPVSNTDRDTNKELDISTTLGKNKEAIKYLFENSKIPVAEPNVFDWKWAISGADKRANLFFIGLYWKQKEFSFDNKDEASAELVRLLRKSTEYAKKYPIQKFKDMLDWILVDSRNKGGYEWGFETLDKRLANYNLEK